MSDIETLRYVMPADSLTPAAVGNAMWGVHKAGMWLDQGLWTAAFAPASTKSCIRNSVLFQTVTSCPFFTRFLLARVAMIYV